MNKIQALNCFARNINKNAINYQEAFMLMAIAELVGETDQWVTSTEVSKVLGMSGETAAGQLKRSQWALISEETRNDRNKKSYRHKLSNAGINKLGDLLCFIPIDTESHRSQSNKDKKGKAISLV
jgi:hypothetical protein